MIPRRITVGGAAALVATLNACTAAAPSPTAPAAGNERELTSAVAAPTTTPQPPSQPSTPANETTAVVNAPAAVDVPAATVVIAVPPIPAHLTPLRPADPTFDDDHSHDGDGPVNDATVAVAWIAALYTGRFDHPARADLAAELTADSALAATALAALPALDVDRLQVRWPVLTDIVDDGDGWWQVTFVLKHTAAGHVGPTTSAPYVGRVHVVAGRVDGWEPPT